MSNRRRPRNPKLARTVPPQLRYSTRSGSFRRQRKSIQRAGYPAELAERRS